MLNRNIKSFYLNGTIKSDSDISRLKEMYLKLLTDEMRSKGYVPVLDLDPQFSIKYNHEKARRPKKTLARLINWIALTLRGRTNT
jgi:hypothetical protein